MRADPLAGLTEAQLAAVTHPGGALAVTGGAGSGKTTVLAHRFAWLASVQGSPRRLLAVVASDRARDELLARLAELVAPPYDELEVVTFHALCHGIVASEAFRMQAVPHAKAPQAQVAAAGSLDGTR